MRDARAHDRVRGLILAAGRGQRLRPLTDTKPKCLVTLAGRTLLDWQLEALRAAGIDEVAVVLGYRAPQVRKRGLTYFANADWADTNMVASLECAADWMAAAPCVVSYGDIVYHPDVVGSLGQSSPDIAIAYDVCWRALWEARFARPEEDAESLQVAAGRVVEIGLPIRDLDRVHGQYLGLLRIMPAGWQRVASWLSRLDERTRRTIDMTHLLQGLVSDGVPVGAVPVAGRWCEVDSVRDLALYETRLGSDAWTHDWRFPEACAS